MPDIKVTDNWDRARYEISLDGALAGFLTYRRTGDTVTLVHTEVDDEFEGHGLGGKLATARSTTSAPAACTWCPSARSSRSSSVNIRSTTTS